VAFIDGHKEEFGVEPICRVVEVAPSTYYDNKSRPPSRRSVTDAELKKEISRVWEENFEVYGSEKIWWQLHREGISCGRDRVARLMRALGIFGVTRQKTKRTTVAKKNQALPEDRVRRNFQADAPNRLWVNDLTYVSVWGGFAYTAFVIDAFGQRIVGWKVSGSLETGLALDALEMAISTRWGRSLEGLVHHSDRGSQYTAIRYSARLEEAGITPSVGSKGDSYDKTLGSHCTSLVVCDARSGSGKGSGVSGGVWSGTDCRRVEQFGHGEWLVAVDAVSSDADFAHEGAALVASLLA